MSKWGRFWIWTGILLLLCISFLFLPDTNQWILFNRLPLVLERTGKLLLGFGFAKIIWWLCIEFAPHLKTGWWAEMRERFDKFFKWLLPNRIRGFVILIFVCFSIAVWFPPAIGPRRILKPSRNRIVAAIKLLEPSPTMVSIGAPINPTKEQENITNDLGLVFYDADWFCQIRGGSLRSFAVEGIRIKRNPASDVGLSLIVALRKEQLAVEDYPDATIAEGEIVIQIGEN